MNIAVYVLSGLLVLFICRTVVLGIKVRRARKKKDRDRGENIYILSLAKYSNLELRHERSARMCFAITFTIVMLVEGILLARYGLHARPHLPGFTEHLWGTAVPFSALLVLCVFFVTGKRFPRLHKFLAYPCAVWSIPMVITGNILISHLPLM